jgi:hypothetical protein
MPVIPVNRVVVKKKIIGKMECQGGGGHKGLLTKKTKQNNFFTTFTTASLSLLSSFLPCRGCPSRRRTHSSWSSPFHPGSVQVYFFHWPGSNPTIVSYNASDAKIYNATNNLARF